MTQEHYIKTKSLVLINFLNFHFQFWQPRKWIHRPKQGVLLCWLYHSQIKTPLATLSQNSTDHEEVDLNSESDNDPVSLLPLSPAPPI
jgi:hypothetical protein